MINFDNHNITGMSYNNHTIKRAYGCDGHLVWSAQTTPSSADPFTITSQGVSSLKIPNYSGVNLCYIVNNGECKAYNKNITISLQNGDTVKFLGWTDDNVAFGSFSGSTGRFTVSGNILSLEYSGNFRDHNTLNCNFENLFNGCTGLTSAEYLVLPNDLTTNAYKGMFMNCRNLTKPPKKLPATRLTGGCYKNMFYNCTSLTSAPVIYGDTVATECCASMFEGCTSLIEAPYLPATNLFNECYKRMFYGCTNLNYVSCNAGGRNTGDNTESWLYGVSDTGRFSKNALATWVRGVSGVPDNWSYG